LDLNFGLKSKAAAKISKSILHFLRRPKPNSAQTSSNRHAPLSYSFSSTGPATLAWLTWPFDPSVPAEHFLCFIILQRRRHLPMMVAMPLPRTAGSPPTPPSTEEKLTAASSPSTSGTVTRPLPFISGNGRQNKIALTTGYLLSISLPLFPDI
jgi:hypothetical protein